MNHKAKAISALVWALGFASVVAVGCTEESTPASGSTTSSGGSSSGTTTSSGGSSGASSSGGSSGGSSGTTSDASTDAPSDAATLCTTPVPNTASQINETFTAASMPAMGTATGGTLETGIYHQTAHLNYEKASGTGTLQGVFAFDATAMTFKIAGIDDGVVQPAKGGTYSIAGNKLTLNFTCPAVASATFDFTYQAPTFTLYNYPAKHVVTAVKQ